MVVCCFVFLVTWELCTTLFWSYLPSQVFPELLFFPHSPDFGGSKPFKAICAAQNILGSVFFRWNMVNLWRVTHWDKSDLSFSSSYLLWGVGLCAWRTYACWDLAQLGRTRVLCMLSHACEFIYAVHMWVHMCCEFTCAVSTRCSNAVIYSLSPYTLWPCTSTVIPEPWDEDAMVLSKTSAQASIPQERISKWIRSKIGTY